MNILDILTLVVIFIFILYGWGIGFINVSISLIGVVVGSFIGISIVKAIHFPSFIEAIIFIILVIIISGLFHLLGRILGKIGKVIPGNRLAGGLVGLLIGSYASGLVLFIISLFSKKNPQFETLMENSTIAKYFFNLFKGAIGIIFKSGIKI